MVSLLAHFATNSKGNVAITFALVSFVLLGLVGAAVDFSIAANQKTDLQAAADTAALAAARELTISDSYATHVATVAEQVARANLEKTLGRASIAITAALTPDGTGVEVKISQNVDSYFGQLYGKPATIGVRAVASALGQKVCVIGLDESASYTVSLDSNSQMTAKDCAVYSNSKSSSGLRSESNAVLRAQLICSAGGKVGGAANYYPRPTTDCPAVKDPLASRAPPTVGPCKDVGLVIKEGFRTLSPGTYCNGLTIDSNAKVRLSPGVYVIKNGPLVVDSNAELEGDYVGLYFTGANTYFRFNSNAKVRLSAPKDGPLAGLVFFEDRNNPIDAKFTITSNYTRNLVGTVYLPRGRFVVDANNPVADQSAYTVIVARRIELYAGPNLVINANYGKTDVPVPYGLGPTGGKARLTR
jgi:Flp pilus assembly protein TadG